MTTEEFDEKYKDYLEEGFDGLEFENQEIVQLCDNYFKKWIKIPGFKYYQIKSKYGTSRVYCDPYREVDTGDLEVEIDLILNKIRNNG